jgi:hypothetical protein
MTTNYYRTGRKEYRNISIVRVAADMANGEEVPADVAADVAELKATNIKFAKTLQTEISRAIEEKEFSEACGKHPKLERLVYSVVNGRRNWRKLMARHCK